MKKAIKYISVLILSLLLLSTVCFATDIDMNLQANESTPESVNKTTDTTTTISTTSSTSDDGLNITNIINIFLIVVGVVLILLGFAILVRLKY